MVPPPPFFQHLLLERPLPLVGLFFVVGLILLFQNRRRTDRKLLVVAVVLIAAAIAVYSLAAAITTTRESLMGQSRRLVDRAKPETIGQLKELFLSQARLVGPDETIWMQYDQLFGSLEAALRKYRTGKQVTRQIHADVIREGVGRSYLSVSTALEIYGRSVNTEWLITWKLQADGQWRVETVQWLKFQGSEPGYGIWR